MQGVTPLSLVIVTIITLWVIGYLLKNSRLSTKPKSNNTSRRGVEVSEHIHVTDLDENAINELTAIIEHADSITLSKFIAFYNPTFTEISDYLESLRHTFQKNLVKPLGSASEIERIAAVNKLLFSDQPAHYTFDSLSKAELRELIEVDLRKNRQMSEEFFETFGSDVFIENFTEYTKLSRDKPVTMYVPKTADNRALLDKLEKGGIVLRGRRIHLRDRLAVLQLNQLNDMAKELKLEKRFLNRDDAVMALSDIPGSAILLSMIYNIDDLYFINPNAIDIAAIRKELSVYNSLAKLICDAHKRGQSAPAVNKTA